AEQFAADANGYWGTSPDPELLSTYAGAGGTGPRVGQVTLCWGKDADAARATVHEQWPNAGLPGQLAQDLPTWTHFEQATSVLSIEQTTEHMACGPSVEPVLEQVSTYVDAGYDHLHFHQIGDDQHGFLDFWVDELGPALSAEGL
ncbi:MAG: LLM class F420-dependent oxidoreductase, partial [Actinomycetota bacterium]|nr:LLM class F420-dependent oxidoreductase [Actinomycetota bacterium]